MKVSVRAADGVAVAQVAGELDTYTVPEVHRAFETLPAAPGARVVVDLREVSFLDSSGVGAIISLYRRTTAADAHLQLVATGAALRLLRLMNLDQVIDVVTDLDDTRDGGAALDQA